MIRDLPPPRIQRGPYVMGVLNLTPNSFSDGGKWDARAGVEHAVAMIDAGADIIDVGGESTRPGADPVEEQVELERVLPLIEALRARSDAPISIDTMKPSVARAAFAAGATIWNDVLALRAPGAVEAAAELNAHVVLMHMQGAPRTMQDDPTYADVAAEVIAFLKARVAVAEAAGVREIWVDPGIGFGKTLTHNLTLLNAVERIGRETGRPVLFGASRKRFIAALDPRATDAGRDRLGGSVAAALLAAQSGAMVLRVHDVAETVQALKVFRAAETAPR